MGWNSQNITSLLIVTATGGFTGLFIYSPGPGSGNLIESHAAQAGTDPYGNAYLKGAVTYGTGPAGASSIQQVTGAFPEIFFGSGASSETGKAFIVENVFSPNTVNEQISLGLGGPTSSAVPADHVGFQLASSTPAAAGIATGFLQYFQTGNANFQRLAWGRLGVSRYTVSGMNGPLALNQFDNFSRTVTQAVITALTRAYSIPADDTIAGLEGTTYKIRAWGSGVWGNPQTTGAIFLSAFGLNFAPISGSFAAADIPAGHNFQWTCELWLAVLTVGAAGTANIGGWFTLSDSTTNTAIGTWPLNSATGVAIDTTSATTFGIAWQWGSAANGASITCPSTVFTREGV